MLEELLDAAVAASEDEQERKRLVREMASFPNEILSVVLPALHQPPLVRQMVAYEVIYALGYPTNAPAIPDLMAHLGDPNRLAWDVAVQTLAEMGPDVAVPYLMQALLDQGRTDEYWAAGLEGLCLMLTQVEPAFARRCCPTITYLLSHNSLPATIDLDFLLDVIERAGNDQTYVLPTLLELSKTGTRSDITERIQHMISTFSNDVMASYALYGLPVVDPFLQTP